MGATEKKEAPAGGNSAARAVGQNNKAVPSISQNGASAKRANGYMQEDARAFRNLVSAVVLRGEPPPNGAHYGAYSQEADALLLGWNGLGSEGALRVWRTLVANNRELSSFELDPDVDSLYPPLEPPEETILIGVDQRPFTEAGQGEVIADLFKDRLRYVAHVGWHIWTGNQWHHDDRDAIMQWGIRAARIRQRAVMGRPMPSPDAEEEERSAFWENYMRDLNWARKAENVIPVRNALSIAQTNPYLVLTADQLDRASFLLGVRNGVVDLRNGELLPARQEYYITQVAGASYDPDARAPRWEQFLSEVFGGDADLIDWIHRAVGYTLTGNVSEQIFFLLYGTGANGKSTFLNILSRVLGNYAKDTPFQTFELGQQSQTGNELVALRGARLVTSKESQDNLRLNESRVKSMTGGDPITARYLYHEFVTFQPSFKLWLATNHKPVIRSTDHAMWRRVRLIPFLQTFDDARKDPALERKLTDELAGILAWAVRGAVAWQQRGLAAPPAVVTATQAYKHESDIVGQFLAECTVQEQSGEARASVLYKAYQAWAEENGLSAMSNVKFGQSLTERGYEREHRNDGNIYHGLRMVEGE